MRVLISLSVLACLGCSTDKVDPANSAEFRFVARNIYADLYPSRLSRRDARKLSISSSLDRDPSQFAIWRSLLLSWSAFQRVTKQSGRTAIHPSRTFVPRFTLSAIDCT